MKNLFLNFFKPKGTDYYFIPNPIKKKNVDQNKIPLGVQSSVSSPMDNNLLARIGFSDSRLVRSLRWASRKEVSVPMAPPPLVLFLRLHKEFGKAASFYVNDRLFIILFDPEMIQELFLSKKNSFINGITHLELRKGGLGDSLLTSENPHYLPQRRYFNQFFTEEKLKNYQKLVQEGIAEQSKHWDNKEIKIYKEMSLLNLRTVFKFFLNYDIKEYEEWICKYMTEMEMQVSSNSLFPTSFFLKKLLSMTKFRYNMQTRKIKKIIKKIVKHQTKNNLVSDSAIYHLLQEEKNKNITRKEVLDHLLTLVSTGFQTSASLASWSIIRMSNQDEMINEIREDLNKNLIKNIIKETLRLYPSVWSVQRQAIEDVEIADCFIPKGAYVLVSSYVTHRDSKYYTNPYKWDPKRWTHEMEKNLPNGSYFPFAMGIKQCIGKDLGVLASNEIIKHLSKNFYWQNPTNKIPTQIPLVTLLPDPNTTIKFKK